MNDLDDNYSDPPPTPPPAKKKRGPKPGAKRKKREAAEAAERAEKEAAALAKSQEDLLGSDAEELEPAKMMLGPSKKEEEEEEDEEEEDDIDVESGDEDIREETKKAFALLMQNHFSEEQKDRYEAFRRSGIKTASVRRLVNHVLQQSVSANIVLSFKGLSKVFVGEIVELARERQRAHGQAGPLLPEHLREAWRIWEQGLSAPAGGRKKMFTM